MQKPKNDISQLQQTAANTVTRYLDKIHCDKDGNLVEQLCYLFRDDKYGLTFNEESPNDFRHMCGQLLALLCNPKISRKIEKGYRPVIGEFLLRMLYFFDNVNGPAGKAALHLNEAKNSEDSENLNLIISRYSSELKETES